MIPICLGWVYVGSQTSHTGVRGALEHASYDTEQSLVVIRDRTGNGKQMRFHHSGGFFEMQSLGADKFSTYAGAEGDAIEPGPIHNYARLWTHVVVAQTFVVAFQHMMDRFENKEIPLLSVKGEPWAYDEYETNLIGSSEQMMDFINLRRDIENATLLCKSPPDVAERVVLATLISLFVQWGTTGSAIVVAYLYVFGVVHPAVALPFPLYSLATHISFRLPLVAPLLLVLVVFLGHT
ncbi:MAG: hypothetical protein Q9160_001008 [Pyrenula sp. 1 TL-2023]